jgi:Glycosyl hydrolases family 16
MNRPRALVALAAPFVIAGGLALQASAGTLLRDGFERLDAGAWVAGDGAKAGGGTLKLAARGSGAIRSRRAFANGGFAVRMRTASAPEALTAFFLYRAPDQITVEVPSAPGAAAMLTVARGSDVTHQARVDLGFDPADGFHTYSLQRRAGSVTFRADGRRLRSFRGGVPRRRMHLHASASLNGPASTGGSASVVDWIERPAR